MDKIDISKMNTADLQQQLGELLREQSNLRLQKSLSLLEGKNHMFANVRRSIARIKTRLTQIQGDEE